MEHIGAITLEELQKKIELDRLYGLKRSVGFIYDIFALICYKHTRVIQYAASKVNWLIVGVASNTNAGFLLYDESERAESINGIKGVESTIIYDNPLDIIEAIKPDKVISSIQIDNEVIKATNDIGCEVLITPKDFM